MIDSLSSSSNEGRGADGCGTSSSSRSRSSATSLGGKSFGVTFLLVTFPSCTGTLIFSPLSCRGKIAPETLFHDRLRRCRCPCVAAAASSDLTGAVGTLASLLPALAEPTTVSYASARTRSRLSTFEKCELLREMSRLRFYLFLCLLEEEEADEADLLDVGVVDASTRTAATCCTAAGSSPSPRLFHFGRW